jgi:signal transduction histidine kinase
MKMYSFATWGRRLTILLAVAVCLAIAMLLGFGYRATRAWQRSSQQLIERDTQDGAELLVTALTRDMQGVQSHMLASREWHDLPSQSVSEISIQVATAFARYPYPESFFTWRADSSDGVVFLNRANRYPSWMAQPTEVHPTPVIVVIDPPGSGELRRTIDAYAASRVQYVALNTKLAGRPYQVVALFAYADSLHERLESVIGFTVDLDWVQHVYFAEILSQLNSIVNRGSRLDIAVLDERNRLVWGSTNSRDPHLKPLPVLFVDPAVSRVALAPDTARIWTVRASPAIDSALLGAAEGADKALVVAGVAVLMLGASLMLGVHVVRADVALSAMRSEFVSSVTHELKMPLANIGTMANTLARRPMTTLQIRTYAENLMKEAKRLTRLVNNLLAYSRISDVSNVYSFEPVAAAELVDDVLQTFRQPISERKFTVEVDIPVDLPLVRADRPAMELALDNLVDNAIRYSADQGRICVTARHDASMVFLEVHDRGMGIRSSELPAVQKKFVRGRMTRTSGSGLGLAIVTRIVADHRGLFVLESEYGVGTTACVGLPVATD